MNCITPAIAVHGIHATFVDIKPKTSPTPTTMVNIPKYVAGPVH
jgi:hypothetical protein